MQFWLDGRVVTLRELIFAGTNFCGSQFWDFLQELNFADFPLERKLEPFCELFNLCFSHLKSFAGNWFCGLGPNTAKISSLKVAWEALFFSPVFLNYYLYFLNNKFSFWCLPFSVEKDFFLRAVDRSVYKGSTIWKKLKISFARGLQRFYKILQCCYQIRTSLEYHKEMNF